MVELESDSAKTGKDQNSKMKNMNLVAALLAVLAVAGVSLAVVFGPLGIGAHDTNRTKLEVRFDSTEADPLASGKLKWEQRFTSDVPPLLERQRIDVEVEDVSTSGLHDVRLNGVSVFSVDVDALGEGEFELDFELDDDESDPVEAVPFAAVGDLVEILNPDGVVILTGLLADKDGTDEEDGTPDETDEPDGTPDETDEPDETDTPEPTP